MAPPHFKVWALGTVLGGATPSPAILPSDFGYDHAEASAFAALSAMAYCRSHQILDWNCGPCEDSGIDLVPGKILILEPNTANRTRAVVGKFGDQDGCLVAFRGTSNLANWVQDLRARLIQPDFGDCDGCRVEEGWYALWKSLRANIMRALGEVGCAPGTRDGRVRVTGHSLGGALTHLAMFDLEGAGYKVATSFSFEAPRVGNAAFSKKFSIRFTEMFPLFRITYNMDPVPHLPPRFMGFRHVSTEVYYNESGQYTVCPEADDKNCSARFGGMRLLLHMADHCTSPVVPGGHFCGKGLSCNASEQEVVLV